MPAKLSELTLSRIGEGFSALTKSRERGYPSWSDLDDIIRLVMYQYELSVTAHAPWSPWQFLGLWDPEELVREARLPFFEGKENVEQLAEFLGPREWDASSSNYRS